MIDGLLLLVLVVVIGLIVRTSRQSAAPPPAAGAPAMTYYWKLTRQAGFSPDVAWPWFVGAKIASAVVLPLILAAVWDGPWWAFLIAVSVGAFLPDVVLVRMRRKR